MDALTYAGNLCSVEDMEKKYGGSRYFFEQGSVCDAEFVKRVFEKYDIDTVVHFAAESHVDRSITSPGAFVQTNVVGTFTLLETARSFWGDRDDTLFHHISTDEVYGSLGSRGYFTESTSYDPRSPYSASKASSDHFVMAYNHTYEMPVTLSNCSNNYGPYQYPEKLIPLMILHILEKKPLPVYGTGGNVRDWLYVEDHAAAIWIILQYGVSGQKYNIGGENEWENIKLLRKLIEIMAKKTGMAQDAIESTITYVADRPGHDWRYAIDCFKIKSDLGWKRSVNFETGLEKTADWYLSNSAWIDTIRSRKN